MTLQTPTITMTLLYTLTHVLLSTGPRNTIRASFVFIQFTLVGISFASDSDVDRKGTRL